MNVKHIPGVQPEKAQAAANGSASAPDASLDDALICALFDGELSDAELGSWLSREPELSNAAAQGQLYQLIGDSLRGQWSALGATSAAAFLTGVQGRLRSEQPAQRLPVASIQQTKTVEVLQVRAPAANDAVFRWKLVAGLASLAAVMAVSWSVLDTAPAGTGMESAAPQLALSLPAQPGATPSRVVAAVSPDTAPLAVNTREGVLIRDAALEALMAEHRQHGGVSALQMPAGFLRNATYDPEAR
jgi:sigma-E factor negative regulatory protein RseA